MFERVRCHGGAGRVRLMDLCGVSFGAVCLAAAGVAHSVAHSEKERRREEEKKRRREEEKKAAPPSPFERVVERECDTAYTRRVAPSILMVGCKASSLLGRRRPRREGQRRRHPTIFHRTSWNNVEQRGQVEGDVRARARRWSFLRSGGRGRPTPHATRRVISRFPTGRGDVRGARRRRLGRGADDLICRDTERCLERCLERC